MAFQARHESVCPNWDVRFAHCGPPQAEERVRKCLRTVLQICRPHGAGERCAARWEWKLAGIGICPRQMRAISSQRRTADSEPAHVGSSNWAGRILLEGTDKVRQVDGARAHGMWTYESRQGRNAATAVCSASAVVTLARFFNSECGVRSAE